jgi:hypothetical protein
MGRTESANGFLEKPRHIINYYSGKFFYWLGRALKFVFLGPFVEFWIVPVGSLALLTLDIFFDRWDLLKENSDFITKAYPYFLAFLVTIITVRFIFSRKKEDVGIQKTDLFADYMATVRVIVEAKTSRFKEAIKTFDKNSDKFNTITQPQEQIKTIGSAFGLYLR